MAITPDYLFIDLDGTLLGSRKFFLKLGFLKSYFYRTRQLGWGFFRSYFLLKSMKKALYDQELASENNLQRVVNSVNPSPEFQTELTQLLHQVFIDLQPCFFHISGALEFIQQAKRKYKLVLATNPVWPLSVVELRLQYAGLKPSDFQFITHQSNMNSVKPRVSYYKELLKKLNVSAEKVIMIGDDPLKDGVAREIGIPTYLLTTWPELKGELNRVHQLGL